MKKIPILAFLSLIRLPKRVALRKIYTDFNVTSKADRERCGKAWVLLEEYSNARKRVVEPESQQDSGLHNDEQPRGNNSSKDVENSAGVTGSSE